MHCLKGLFFTPIERVKHSLILSEMQLKIVSSSLSSRKLGIALPTGGLHTHNYSPRTVSMTIILAYCDFVSIPTPHNNSSIPESNPLRVNYSSLYSPHHPWPSKHPHLHLVHAFYHPMPPPCAVHQLTILTDSSLGVMKMIQW